MSDPLKPFSKFLSYVLRHKPDAIGLTLDAEGWANIDELIAKSDKPLTHDLIREIVKTNAKHRFILSEDGTKIRANQGHSIKIDLGLQPQTPPPHLYHGTATRFWDTIQTQGLKPMNRNHVHLSADTQTAHSVGSRHGKPIILVIDAEKMRADGHDFFQSENGVWLTKAVAPKYITPPQ